MVNRDLVEFALAGPIDWERFEALVSAVLAADDLPTLRKIGGRGDFGIDAEDVAFYDGQRRVQTIVQITAAKAQSQKAIETLRKLRDHGVQCRHLIMVFQQPVASTVKREISEALAELGASVDIRDAEYLASQLSKPHSTIFARFFSDVRAQVEALFAKADPLEISEDRERHALLATLGAFVLGPRARLARNDLFEQTLLAALVSIGPNPSRDGLERALNRLLPGETIDSSRLDSALSRLRRESAIDDQLRVSKDVVSRLSSAMAAAGKGYNSIRDFVFKRIGERFKLADASYGYAERNLRRILLFMLRSAGPVVDPSALAKVGFEKSLQAVATANLTPEVGKALLAAVGAFVENSAHASVLGPMVRCYSALAMRNLDPLGQAWQSSVLSRSAIALDTDAALAVLIRELPEHRPLLSALSALQRAGVGIVVAEHVFEEVVSHLSRADRTFRRFENTLLRLPPAAVDSEVWHAVVRGYYYAVRDHGFKGSPSQYWRAYYDVTSSAEFVSHALSRRLPLSIVALADVPSEWDSKRVELEEAVLDRRETSRQKAEFRAAGFMETRVRQDVMMILSLAARSTPTVGAKARGYLASEDRAFLLMEGHSAWPTREPVLICTRVVPELAAFIIGPAVSDDDLVRLLFEPAAVAAAEQMRTEISNLAAVGVELGGVPLDRLEFDLAVKLKEHVRALNGVARADESDPDPASDQDVVLHAARGATQAGYTLAGTVQEVLDNYESMKTAAHSERQERMELEAKLQALASATRTISKKGRRRFNKVLRELDIVLNLEDDEADDQNLFDFASEDDG